jgi:hypothetical protein
VCVDLLADLEDELIEAQVDFGLNLVVEESLVERVQRPVGGIVVQVKRVQQELSIASRCKLVFRSRLDKRRVSGLMKRTSIMAELPDSRIWSVRIHGRDNSMGNWRHLSSSSQYSRYHRSARSVTWKIVPV